MSFSKKISLAAATIAFSTFAFGSAMADGDSDVSVTIPINASGSTTDYHFCDGSNKGSGTGASGYNVQVYYGPSTSPMAHPVDSFTLGTIKTTNGLAHIPDGSSSSCSSALTPAQLTFTLPKQDADYVITVYVQNGIDPSPAEVSSYGFTATLGQAISSSQTSVTTGALGVLNYKDTSASQNGWKYAAGK